MNVDFKKSEIKLAYGKKWKFEFRENGSVVISDIVDIVVKENKNTVVKWRVHLDAPDLKSALIYIWVSNRSKGEHLIYDDLEDV